MSKRLWIIEVRGPRQKYGYPIDNVVFEKRFEAVRYRRMRGAVHAKYWHIVELVRKDQPNDRAR